MPIKSKKLRKRNMIINYAMILFFIILLIVFLFLKKGYLFYIVTIVVSIITKLGTIKMFSCEIKACQDIIENEVKCNKEYIEIQSNIRSLENEIDDLENRRDSISLNNE